jgi:hypothetical protein
MKGEGKHWNEFQNLLEDLLLKIGKGRCILMLDARCWILDAGYSMLDAGSEDG